MTDWTRVFFDEFAPGGDVDRSRWTSPAWTPNDNKAYIGRTGIRNPKDFRGQVGLIPCTSENGADLRFSTYNPEARPAGSAFLGAEMSTIQKWGGDGQAVKFEASVKCPDMPGGGVMSVFAYALCSSPGPVQNEIDFEFASNHLGVPPSQQFLTNVFVCASGGGTGPKEIGTGNNLRNRQKFSLIYTPFKSVEWLLDDKRVRFDDVHVPDLRMSGGMHLYLNFWAPQPGWSWAYNQNLQPSGAPGQEWHYYVKNAAVYYG